MVGVFITSMTKEGLLYIMQQKLSQEKETSPDRLLVPGSCPPAAGDRPPVWPGHLGSSLLGSRPGDSTTGLAPGAVE